MGATRYAEWRKVIDDAREEHRKELTELLLDPVFGAEDRAEVQRELDKIESWTMCPVCERTGAHTDGREDYTLVKGSDLRTGDVISAPLKIGERDTIVGWEPYNSPLAYLFEPEGAKCALLALHKIPFIIENGRYYHAFNRVCPGKAHV